MPFLFSPTIRREDNAYFAAMNTPKGFISEFEPLFSPYRRYIIKGGPGTGKSTLMKKIAKEATMRGHAVDYYYCSSDTDSLDAIVIPKLSFAMLDGTAPHITEPSLVGIKDRYLDLAQFLTPETLREKERIATLGKKKQEAYQKAYRLLSASFSADLALSPLRQDAFDEEKCKKTLARLIERLQLKTENIPSQKNIPISALGSAGYVALDSYKNQAKTQITVSDRYGVAPLVFDLLKGLLEQNEISYHYSLSPLTLAIDTIYLPQKRVLISSLPFSDTPAITINCERFLLGRGQGLYKGQKAILAAEKSLVLEAMASLTEASIAHREIEHHYIAAMNFASLNTYTGALIREIFPS